MKTKRLLTVLLSILLLVNVMFITVAFAEDAQTAVAKIGEESYETLADALTAASTMSGDVTVEIYDKVTLSTSLSGSYDSITFVGKDTDAEIYLEVQGYITASGKAVYFEDLILSKSKGAFITNAGFMNVAFGVYDVESVTYTRCTFSNGSYASSGVVTYEGCTFYISHEKYGLWAYGNAEITVNECIFNDRGIKMYAEGAAKVTDLTVTNSDFTAATEKPAIVLAYGESVTLSGNDYPTKGVFELDLDGSPNGTTVTSTDEITCINDKGACGVIVDGQIYTTVAQAAAVATEGSSVTLLHDTTEEVTFAEGVILNTNGYSADNVTGDALEVDARIGYTYYDTFVKALQALESGDTLTLMRDVTITEDWDNRSNGAKTTVPVTIDGDGHTLTFTSDCIIGDGGNYTSVFRFEAATTVKNLTMDMSAAESNWSNRFRAISAKYDLTVDSCTFIGNPAYTNTNAIIFGEGASEATSEVSVTNCTFKNWRNGVSDNQNGKDTALSLTIAQNTFESANVNVSAAEDVSFTGNTMTSSWVGICSYTNADNLTVTFTGNTLSENTDEKTNFVLASPSNVTTDDSSVLPVASMGDEWYLSMDDLLADILEGSTLTLTDDVQLFATLTLPADVMFCANGYSVDGTVYAGGDVTFAGVNKITSFNPGSNNTITIGEGASLETTSGRMLIAHGNTFNITGSIDDAKSADVSTLTPSLVAPGASFTGAGVSFNVTNAYIKFTNYCSTKNTAASGTFDFNVTNSIWEQSGKLAFEVPSNQDPTVNFNLTDSVLTTASHLVFAVTKGNIVIDNSNVNVDKYSQLENRSSMTVKNGSVVHASNAVSSNAKNPGTLYVDNATYVGTGEYSGADVGTGTLVLKHEADVTLGIISQANVYKDSSSTLTYSTLRDTAVIYELGNYVFSLSTDKTALKATESLTATVSISDAYYSAEYTLTFDPTKFSCEADADGDGVIYVTNLYKGEGGELASYTLVALNDIESVSEGNVLSVSGDVIQYKDQLLNAVENDITGDAESIKISLNYTAEVLADYVQGYSLVLVKGNDSGYAYGGTKMFYSEHFGAYAILVEGAVSDEMIDASLSKATGCETIAQSYDVNAEYVTDGKVDLKDATAVYACSVLDFDVAAHMELFLRADVNGDGVVNMLDVNAVTMNYTR